MNALYLLRGSVPEIPEQLGISTELKNILKKKPKFLFDRIMLLPTHSMSHFQVVRQEKG